MATSIAVQVVGASMVIGAVFGVVGYACYLSWKAQKDDVEAVE